MDNTHGQVFWITGLSGVGKTTLALALEEHFNHAVLLDGDILREALGVGQQGFDAESRKNLAFTYTRICKMLAHQGVTVIIATISLFHELHAWNRENLPNYVEFFMDVSEETRRSRDPKGLYKVQTKGSMQMAGLEIQVELPLAPHIRIAELCSVEVSVTSILNYLRGMQ